MATPRQLAELFAEADDEEIYWRNNQKRIRNLLEAEREEMEYPSKRGGSVPGRRTIHRDRVQSGERLYQDYFAEYPRYPANRFRRRFRMGRDLFLRIVNALEDHDEYFRQKTDAAGKLGHSALQKATMAMRQLAYGTSSDMFDEYFDMAESTGLEAMKRFCSGVINVFGAQYLRSPDASDLEKILAANAKRGFPGMLGSLDCMHWVWKNCPTAWHGQFSGKEKAPTVILEAVASSDLWIWHAFFGQPGTLNDINVLNRSNLMDNIASGRLPPVEFTINNNKYSMGYYLADGIYPKWSTIVQAYAEPRGQREQYFTTVHESVRKDIERAFGVLQGRFQIISRPARLWKHSDLEKVMKACIIMHNMIVEDERDDDDPQYLHEEDPIALVSRQDNNNLEELTGRDRMIKDRNMYMQLRTDLSHHLWQMRGNQE